jgi:hypothetical protein
MYQAYSNQIADAALARQCFVAPFSFSRMTWIKPSLLWLMHRSHWGQKSNQERTLAVHIKRTGWDKALSLGVLTHPEPTVFTRPGEWEEKFQQAHVHVQWDTERSLRGAGQNHLSIQVGISRHLIGEFVEDWIVRIEDLTPTVTKMRSLLRSGHEKNAQRLLPAERVYPVDATVAKRLQMG